VPPRRHVFVVVDVLEADALRTIGESGEPGAPPHVVGSASRNGRRLRRMVAGARDAELRYPDSEAMHIKNCLGAVRPLDHRANTSSDTSERLARRGLFEITASVTR
jgi:hypothetical protein